MRIFDDDGNITFRHWRWSGDGKEMDRRCADPMRVMDRPCFDAKEAKWFSDFGDSCSFVYKCDNMESEVLLVRVSTGLRLRQVFHSLILLLLCLMSQLTLAKKALEARSPPRTLKVKVLVIDNSALLARYSKILLGRCLNPHVQDVNTFIFMMPKFWKMEGRTTCLNLGNGRFQFEFKSKRDLKEIMRLRASCFDG